MKHPLLLACLAIACLGTPPAWAGKVYQWRDANGKLHLSDKPPAAAPAGSPGSPLQTAPETTLRSAESPASSTDTRRSPVNRQRIDHGIRQYQQSRETP